MIHSARDSDDYHDLIITCEGNEWKVHRVVVCTRSRWFKKACQTGFKVHPWAHQGHRRQVTHYHQEGESGSIELKEVQPALINKLVDYLYNFDYDDSDDSNDSNDDVQIKADSNEVIPIEADANDDVQIEADSNDNVQNDACSQSPQAGRLAVNAAMYTIGDRYNLNKLKDLAKAKFATALVHCWNKEEFPDTIRFIYEHTLAEDRGLRDCLAPTLIQHKRHLRSDDKFMAVVQTHGEFAVDLLDAWTDPNQLSSPMRESQRCKSCKKKFPKNKTVTLLGVEVAEEVPEEP
ncbi:MAG: hypothetical protein Q9223_004556 [Gallowayella weberi]